MMRPMRPFEKRLLAVLLLFAVIAAVVLAVALPYGKMQKHYDDAIADRLDRIARYQRIAATGPEVKKAIADVAAKDPKRFYLKSSAPALAAADIQQIVQTLVEANKLQLDSMQIAPPKQEEDYRRITLNLRLRGPMRGLQSMLYSLETTMPYLFVDNLNIQSTVRQNYMPASGVDPEVRCQFDLSGYARIEKKNVAARR